MPSVRRGAWRWIALTLATGLVALTLAAVVVASVPPQWLAQQKPICTDETWFTDCIKPTFPPTDTPEPTPTIPTEIYDAGADEDDDLPTVTPVPLIDQVTDMVRDGEYDAIARVRVLSHRRVTVTTLTYDFFIAEWTRSRVKVTETLRGDLPATLDIVSLTGSNGALDISGDYILFLRKSLIGAESSQFPGDPARVRLNQSQLDEVGGEASSYLGRQVWAVDGASVYRVPVEHIVSHETAVATDLAVAKANGETMTLAALDRILRPDDN